MFLRLVIPLLLIVQLLSAKEKFAVLGLYKAQQDQAHISFVHEANRWFAEMGKKHHFRYDSSADWSKLNDTTLKDCQVVVFLDARPDKPEQRAAFRRYMEQGGGWLGFHFAAFALTPSAYPQNWDWYHHEFLGSGQYVSNTWRPTSAQLKIEDRNGGMLKGIPELVKSSPNEWYRWEKDLRLDHDIRILASIDPSSFPLGTGPKPHEIWHSGYYPVVWTNKRYRMVYFNMGHNDIDYDHGTSRELSHTFGNNEQDQIVLFGQTVLIPSRTNSMFLICNSSS